MFTGCPKTSVSPQEQRYPVTFTVDGGNGKLTAKIGEKDCKNNERAPLGATVVFTAQPADGFAVDKWTIQGGSFEKGTGVNGGTTATVKVSAALTVKVSFKQSALPPALKFKVNFSVEGTNGTLSATVDGAAITSPAQVQEGKTVTFTAEPSTEYKVKEWTLGGTPVTGNTTNTYSCPVTAAAEIKVSFTDLYTKVAYADLENYLANTASETEINYIEITGTIPIEDFKGYYGTAALGRKIQAAASKKIALKLPQTVPGPDDMQYCFNECANLVSLANIPANVKDMQWTFSGCSSLKRVKLNCNYNSNVIQGWNAFHLLFENCTALKAGGIQVKAAYHSNYTTEAALNTMRVPGSTVEEKRVKFSTF